MLRRCRSSREWFKKETVSPCLAIYGTSPVHFSHTYCHPAFARAWGRVYYLHWAVHGGWYGGPTLANWLHSCTFQPLATSEHDFGPRVPPCSSNKKHPCGSSASCLGKRAIRRPIILLYHHHLGLFTSAVTSSAFQYTVHGQLRWGSWRLAANHRLRG